MAMFQFPEADYQKQLIVAALDDLSPNSALSHVHGGQFSPNSNLWRDAVVEFLYVNVKAELLEGTHRKDISGAAGAELLKNLLVGVGVEDTIDVEIIWNSLYFNATAKLAEFLHNFNLDNWGALKADVNKDFVTALRDMYSKGK